MANQTKEIKREGKDKKVKKAIISKSVLRKKYA